MGSSEIGFEQWLARPGERLVDHLREVAKHARRFAPPTLKDAAELAGLVHDLGKATSFFQHRLHSPDRTEASAEANHSYISALFGAWVARQRGLDPLILFLAVARHHGPLRSPWELLPHPADIDPPDFPDLGRSGLRRTLRALPKQLCEVSKSWPSLCAVLGLPDPAPFVKDEIWSILRDLAEEAQDLSSQPIELLTPETRKRYWETNIIFSSLIDADKKLAGGYQPPARIHNLPADLVRRYLGSAHHTAPSQSPLQPFREQLFQTVDRQIQERPLAELYPRVLTLTAPTGAGKTLTVLHAALQLRARVAQETGHLPRIIYALPYINLIEQTAAVIQEVLHVGGIDPKAVLLEHHHLAPLRPPSHPGADAKQRAAGDHSSIQRTQAEDDAEVEETLLLAESWDAEIILTTFVQVFHTLVGYQNRALKKLHTLSEGAILILDEVQTLDACYWPLLGALLSDLPQWNVTVILMTATQPRLIHEGEALELVDPPLANYPPRVRLQPTGVLSLEQFAELIAQNSRQSQLVVVNSIPISIKLFNLLKHQHKQSCLSYLSTNITPRDRRKRLEEIRQRLRHKGPIILVSTQVVEAGVDVDFALGWREWGPLESLLQVAGRVNRNAEHDLANLFVVPLEEGQGNLIYGRILLDAAREVLRAPTLDEELVQRLSEYFMTIEERISQEQAHRLLLALPRLDYDRANIDCQRGGDAVPISCFRLIEELPSLRIVVEQDEEARQAIQALREAVQLKDLRKRRHKVREAFQALEHYTITPLLPRAVQNLPNPLLDGREDLRLIQQHQLESFYDQDTGFKWTIEQFQ